MNKTRIGRGIACIGISLLLPAAIPAAPLYSAQGNFSNSVNPNSPWTYGWETTLNSTFNVSPFDDTGNAPLCGGAGGWWQGPDTTWVSDCNPYIGMSPGAANEFTLVRFTSPVSGTFSVSGLFTGLDNATTHDYVLLNGTPLFDTILTGGGSTTDFNLPVTLNVGDKIDFVVGVGPDNSYANDSTGLVGDIYAPEPATIWLAVGALVCAAWTKQGRIRRNG